MFSLRVYCRLLLVALMLSVMPSHGAEPTTQPADAFKVEMTVTLEDGDRSAVVFFIEHVALVFGGDANSELSVVFDLNEKSWRDIESNQTVTLTQAEQWAEASRKQALESLKSVQDDKFRAFMLAMIDPKFQVSEKDDRLILQNEVISFVITPGESIENSWLDRLIQYDQLNAYHKAMTERQFPPFVQLAMLSEFSKRRVWPGVMEMSVSTPGGDIRIPTTFNITALSESEIAAGKKLLDEMSN